MSKCSIINFGIVDLSILDKMILSGRLKSKNDINEIVKTLVKEIKEKESESLALINNSKLLKKHTSKETAISNDSGSELNFVMINRNIRNGFYSEDDLKKTIEHKINEIYKKLPFWLETLETISKCSHSYDVPIRHRVVYFNQSHSPFFSGSNRQDNFLFIKKCTLCNHYEQEYGNSETDEPTGFEGSKKGENILPEQK